MNKKFSILFAGFIVFATVLFGVAFSKASTAFALDCSAYQYTCTKTTSTCDGFKYATVCSYADLTSGPIDCDWACSPHEVCTGMTTTCTQNVSNPNAGSITISSISPNPASTSTTVTGTGVGGTSYTSCNKAYFNKLNGATYSIDGGTATSFTLTTTTTGDSAPTCPNAAAGNEWNYSFSIPINTSALTVGSHTVVVSANDVATSTKISSSSSFAVTTPNSTGTLTPTSQSCTIAIGASTCNAILSWSTTPSQGTSAVTSPVDNSGSSTNASGVSYNSIGGFHAADTYSGNNVSVSTYYTGASTRNFYLYNNGNSLVSGGVTATATCGANTWNGTICIPVVTVSATTPYSTTPSTNVSFAYTSSTTSSAGTECELLDNTQTALTSYSSTNPIVYPSASTTGSFAYYIKCRDKTTTTATATSNQITVTVASVPPPVVVAPTFTPAPGTYTSAQSVVIKTTTLLAKICYTIDGTTPTATTPGTCSNGTIIGSGSAVSVSSTETINAIGTKAGYINSPLASGTYTINNVATSTTNCGPTVANPVHYQCNPGVLKPGSNQSLTSQWKWNCLSLDGNAEVDGCTQSKSAPKPIEN
jgi:hypothetical protein